MVKSLDYEHAVHILYITSAFSNRPPQRIYTKSKVGVVLDMAKSIFDNELIPKDLEIYKKLEKIFVNLYSLMYDSDEKDSFFKHFNMQISMKGLEVKSLHITANIEWQEKIFITFEELNSLSKFI